MKLLLLFLFFSANICQSVFASLNLKNVMIYTDIDNSVFSYKQKQDTAETKSLLIKKWMLEQIIINGKKEEPSDFEIEFSPDGTYYLIENDEPEEGIWELDDEAMAIIFNGGTDEEFIWQIVTLDEKKVVVKESYGKTVAIYTLVPWVDWRELIGE